MRFEVNLRFVGGSAVTHPVSSQEHRRDHNRSSELPPLLLEGTQGVQLGV